MTKDAQMLEKLMALGLTEKQGQIYISIQKHGICSVLDIFRDTHIQRPTIYENAVTLESLGLIETVVKGAKKRLAATAPERLQALIKQKELVACELVEDLASIKKGDVLRNPVRLYAGREGAKKLADLILESKGKTVLTLGNHELLYALFTERDLRRLWEARVAKNIHVEALFPSSDRPTLQRNKDYSETGNIRYNRTVRVLPASIDWGVMYTIVDDNVLFWSAQKEDFFFQFSSPSYAASLRTVFQILWQISKPLETQETN
ncbi:MAG: hypothetical protein IPJ68_05780 [Candidatus Moraniibacteriota bacterium]|nr:MAG: hypothetical protein IPJ68_05780 [Candidatus Moranbacteria bacterium]